MLSLAAAPISYFLLGHLPSSVSHALKPRHSRKARVREQWDGGFIPTDGRVYAGSHRSG